ncbi:MFS transporter [Nocardioides jishulii]|uniref:MFS transporter n=1 Tax=Nocardioides jishulii TaxID=2575440 RepID=A0A4U2YMR1_9ACTN|nr:MFS transporter [Nocardioides jishulii]QCX27759.1 MFS transporter [Nocardioides jishulii]TKI62566.1 MFS transporter [Nocardioides jishulii]
MSRPETLPDTGATLDVAGVQRRTVGSLVAVQATGALGITIGIATSSLLARDLSGSEAMAGLSQTFQVLGTAAAAFLLARVMSRRGRRVGLVTGYLAAACGALLAVVAGTVGSIALLLVAMVLLGSASASNNAARYAATDLAAPAHKARALSVVVWATTIGAVVGPNLTGPAAGLADVLSVPELTGPFVLGAVGTAAAGLLAAVLLRPDPLLTARRLAGDGHELSGGVPTPPSLREVWTALRSHPLLVAATLGLAGAHATMVAVMVMTPLHMEHGGAELRVIGFVISIHVLGMFAFAPLSGWAADRWGRARLLVVGAGVLLTALLLSGISPQGSSWQIFAGLFLLGLGWSISTIAASTLLAEHAPLEVRADVQGAADMTMSLAAAVGSALAGVIVGQWGYGALNAYAAVLALAVLGAGVAALRHASTHAARHAAPH